MQKIFLDTSFILTALKFKIDIFTELKRICDFPYKVFIFDRTLKELEGKKEGKLALQLIKRKKIKITKAKKEKNVDKLLLGLKNCIVATQDRILKKSLKRKSIKIITIRQKKYLSLN